MGKTIQLQKIEAPKKYEGVAPTNLSDETMSARKKKVLQRMKETGFDTLIIYADKEHGGNFEYLTGFIPRFEEGLLILENTGEATLMLGNENLKMAKVSRISAELLHSPFFSLPNQPMDNEKSLEELFSELGFSDKKKLGLVGWKMFTPKNSLASAYFDVPYFIVEAIKNCMNKTALLENAAFLLIGEEGARTTNNANEVAHYEYGANLSSNCILTAMDAVEPGISEAELGNLLTAEGQYNTVVTIAATGQRFEQAVIYPTHKKVKQGDPLSMTTAFKGGLSSRTGFVIHDESELPVEQNDYLSRVAKPYFNAVAIWLETVKIGIEGQQVYQTIEEVLPKDTYHWHLNPGHLVADEEWMSSPIYSGSREVLKSGMIFQIDIIPSIAGYTGVSAEECIALADASLRNDLQTQYPELWARIIARRTYIKEVLNIQLGEELLPLSNTVAYLRPFYLAKNQAFCCK
ncbi:M24 family metallopeptidase [Enterococcus sp. AZ194]|uniref:M24 family metallopeptidase n=1 Tax=Enterococcus sp. AZ194 TaxID=2774629 RepID=UPI003F688A6D